MLFFKKKVTYPVSVDPEKVGQYSLLTKSGGGFFYDELLEYRVWVHPEVASDDPESGDDSCYSFPTYQDALAFSMSTPGAEEPLALVRQNEWINEPEPGKYEHKKGERITEWKVEWLLENKREQKSIERFLKRRGA